jgi:hypothetical protein
MNLVSGLGFVVAWIALTASPSRGQTGFLPGDVYLHSAFLVDLSNAGGGLLRVNPYTGATQLVVSYVASASTTTFGAAAYDPYRNRIIAYAGIGSSVLKLYFIDGAGGATDPGFPIQSYSRLAPRGDGIVYCVMGSTSANISYFDAANAPHTLMDAAGLAPYAFPGSAIFIRSMIFHAGQNALFVGTSSFTSVCSGGNAAHLSLYRLPLSVDGTRVVGPVTCAQATVDPGGIEAPINWSIMPSGQLLLVVDTNSNTQQPRMQVIDPVTLSASPFASSGPYAGAATTYAGAFCTELGGALILDSASIILRWFPMGSSGNGTVFSAPAYSGSGEGATMFEIEPAGVSTTLKANLGSLSLAAGGTQTLDFTPGAGFAGALYLVGGSTTGWTPGIPFGGFVVPLVYDSYTDHTINDANLGPLFNNLGFLSAGGTSQAQLVVPPNAPPAFAGVTVFHAAVAFAPGLVLTHVSNPVALTLTP